MDGNAKVGGLRSNQTVICVKGEGNRRQSLPSTVDAHKQIKCSSDQTWAVKNALVKVDGPGKLRRTVHMYEGPDLG